MEYLKQRLYLTFVLQDRWKFFVDGLWMTLLLTAASFILGSLVGAAFCTLKLSKFKRIKKITNTVISVLVQLPTLVLLMMFVYIIFGETSLPATLIVIFGLTLKAGAYISEIFSSAVTAVNPGEIEAAKTLGLSRLQVFLHITLPQAITSALPVYKNQFIITLQETSIVGYLAIVDLTRASDIVTARTYDAFFGLIIISILYLLVGYLGNLLLGLLGHRKHLGGDDK